MSVQYVGVSLVVLPGRPPTAYCAIEVHIASYIADNDHFLSANMIIIHIILFRGDEKQSGQASIWLSA